MPEHPAHDVDLFSPKDFPELLPAEAGAGGSLAQRLDEPGVGQVFGDALDEGGRHLGGRGGDGFRFGCRNILGKDRMTAQMALVLAVMMALALGSIRAKAHDRMCSGVRPPPVRTA